MERNFKIEQARNELKIRNENNKKKIVKEKIMKMEIEMNIKE